MNVPPRDCLTSQPPLTTQIWVDGSNNRSTTGTIESIDTGSDINAMLTSGSDISFHAWSTLADGNHVHTTMNTLDPNLPHDDTCHHDSGMNHHVFHNCNAFETYEPTNPLMVCGFGHNLSMTAIEYGMVQLQSHCGKQTHYIILQNVLHIPAVCINLISGVQLDKAGVTLTLGNGLIMLAAHRKTIIEGKIINDMYCLNLKITLPNTVSLASQLSAPSLISRVESHSLAQDFCTA